ncbi:hypothetical protein GCM10025862_12190 [Arsenicicoccus piscis]|uniref:Abi family protein n=1 Tax=Arsenicicoccus piscis TaxID=673954 RepID=A0ABQ6HL60_9MICO|nr:hypothetical protein GCM10025862_12190 [Arsenicicoccus piscis]
MPQPRRAPRPSRPRGTSRYDKPPMELDDLVDRLADRGLVIAERGRALRYLRHIGYYRLSPYTIPFQQSGPEHRLRDGRRSTTCSTSTSSTVLCAWWSWMPSSASRSQCARR